MKTIKFYFSIFIVALLLGGMVFTITPQESFAVSGGPPQIPLCQQNPCDVIYDICKYRPVQCPNQIALVDEYYQLEMSGCEFACEEITSCVPLDYACGQ